jgi:Family of unknown function (DUF6157)
LGGAIPRLRALGRPFKSHIVHREQPNRMAPHLRDFLAEILAWIRYLPSQKGCVPPMHSTNYFSTLISASPDCKASTGTVPSKEGTIAALQHEMLAAAPYQMSSDDLLCAVEARRKGIARNKFAAFRKAFFSEPRACLRGSPLVKSYGWGIHHDGNGRMALVGRETSTYAAMMTDPSIAKVAGMRSRRP